MSDKADAMPLPTGELERSIVWSQEELDKIETAWGLGDLELGAQNMGMEIAKLRRELAAANERIVKLTDEVLLRADSYHHWRHHFERAEKAEAECERLRMDAGRWRKARTLFTGAEIKHANEQMRGMAINEEDRLECDAAIDAARERSEG